MTKHALQTIATGFVPIAISVALSVSNLTAAKGTCSLTKEMGCAASLDIVKTERCRVQLLRFQNCGWQDEYVAPGFCLLQTNQDGWSDVLWGRFEECYRTEIHAVDLDSREPCEVLTLFMDEGNLWGYVHRLRLSDSGCIFLQSLKIPAMGFTDAADKTGIFVSPIDDNELGFSGTLADTALVRVVYDLTGDSLRLEIDNIRD